MTEDATPLTSSAARPRRRRWLITALALLLVLALLPAGAWWWASTEGSLRQGLRLAQWFMPEGQSLEFRDALGSITGGGSIAHLEWRMPGTAVAIDQFRLDWSLGQLAGRALDVRALAAGSVQVRLTPQPPAPPAAPFTMPAEVVLPIRLSLPLAVGSLRIETVAEDGSSSTQQIDDLSLQYRFDGTAHALTLDSVRHRQSSAQASAQLDARTLALQARLDATLRDLVADNPFAMQLALRTEGTLGGGDAASLDFTLDGSEISSANAGAQIHAQAVIRPWAAQPAQQIELQFSRIDAHAFHGDAPVTDLNGRATLLPVADAATAAWDYLLELANDAPGAWDQQQLPLQTLAANGRLDLQQLGIDTARVDLFGSAPAGSVTLAGTVPLQSPAQSTLELQLQQLDLQPLMATLPRTAISGTASVAPEQVRADIRNADPGPLDQERLPLEQLLADIRISPETWRAADVSLTIGAGGLRLQGQLDRQTEALQVSSEVRQLPVGMIHSRLAEGLVSELSGTLRASGSLQQGVDFATDITGNVAGTAAEPPARGPWEIRAVQASGRWSPTQLAIASIHLDAFRARIDGSDIEVALPGLDAFRASIAASAPGLTLTADAAMPVQSGSGSLALELTSADQVLDWLRGLPLIGEHIPIGSTSGTASLQADWQGNWRDWLDGFTEPQAHPELHLDARATAQTLVIELSPAGTEAPARFEVPQLNLRVQGNLATASADISGDVLVGDTRARLDLGARMQQSADAAGPLWSVAIDRLAAAATLSEQGQPWQLQLGGGLQFTVQTSDGIELRSDAGSATLTAPPGTGSDTPLQVDWQPLTWHRTAEGATRLISSGSIRGIQPAWIDTLLAEHGMGPLAGAGLRSDLVASGDWDVRMADRVDIRAHLKRDSGDLWLLAPAAGPRDAPAGGDLAAGIRGFDLQVQSGGEDVELALTWDTDRAGTLDARLRTQLAQHEGTWTLPEAAPLTGTVRAQLQDMGAWGFLTPPGWRVRGALEADITLGGTVQSPQLQGSVTGGGLNIRSMLDGVDLHNGTLRATLDGRRLAIDELVFEGGTGSRAYVSGQSGNRTQPPTARGRMNASGMIDWSGVADAPEGESGIAMDFEATLDEMQVLVRNDRQLTLSGDLSAGLQEGTLSVRGDLAVDRAAIVLPEAGAPTLGDDVTVVREGDEAVPEAQGQLETARPMDLQIQLDLGRDLALQGHGITTRLEGELTVRSATSGQDPVSLIGEIRTDQGRYRAWGQALDVETGEVLFNGPAGNPALNLLAIRPDIEVRAGVRVTGTLLAPQLRLFSEPELPEAEKLSWVVLGRAPAAGSAEGNSMQQAALGLLAGQVGGGVASGLGLDEVGLSDEGVSVGKRLGDELYVTYVAGLSGAASTLYLFYDITRRLTVRGQTGDSSAVDLIYTITFD